MDKPELIFEERQYLGHNRLSIVIRTILALFCFIGYYWSENPKPVQVSFVRIGSYPIANEVTSGTIFFIMGVSILVLSAALTFVLHIKTSVHRGYILLEGFWTSRMIKIDLNNVVAIRKSRYRRNALRRTAYNLHNRGIVRFYTSGERFVEVTDNAGFVFRIGTQRPEELYNVLKKETGL